LSALAILFKLQAYLTLMSLCVDNIHSKRPCTPSRLCHSDSCANLCANLCADLCANLCANLCASHATSHCLPACNHVHVTACMRTGICLYIRARTCMCKDICICVCIRMHITKTAFIGSAETSTGNYLGRVPLFQGCISLSLDGVHVSHSPLSPPSLSFQSSLQCNHTQLSTRCWWKA